MTEFNAGTAALTEEETMNATNAFRYETAEKLSSKMHITLEEAKAALEAADWNMLTATHLLEQEAFKRKQELDEVAASAQTAEEAAEEETTADSRTAKTTLKGIGHAVKDLIVRGNRSRFAIHKGGEELLEMPVTVLALLLLFSFGTCAFLMIVGLLAGCRYSVNGKSLGAEA